MTDVLTDDETKQLLKSLTGIIFVVGLSVPFKENETNQEKEKMDEKANDLLNGALFGAGIAFNICGNKNIHNRLLVVSRIVQKLGLQKGLEVLGYAELLKEKPNE